MKTLCSFSCCIAYGHECPCFTMKEKNLSPVPLELKVKFYLYFSEQILIFVKID